MKILTIIFLNALLIFSGCISTGSPPVPEEEVPEDTLTMLWGYTYDLDGGSPTVHPMITESGLVVSSGDFNVTALETESGKMVWRTKVNTSSLLTNRRFGKIGHVITGSVLRNVKAWHELTGEQLWSVHFPEPLTWSVFTGLSVTNNRFITYGREGDLYKISLDGMVEQSNFGARVYDSRMESGNLLLSQARSTSALFTMINPRNDTLIWVKEYEGFGYPAFAEPVIEEDIVYVGTASGPSGSQNGFFALDARNGEELWRREGLQTYSVVSEGQYLYINDGGGIAKLRKQDGSEVWYTDFRSSGTAPIAYGYGHIYAPHSGVIRIVDAETGKELHRVSPPDGSTFWLVTAGKGRIFAQSNRALYAFAPWGHQKALEE